MKDARVNQLLKDASLKLRDARKYLDIDSSRCRECGLTHYHCWTDAQVDKALAGMVTKLDRFVVVNDLDPKREEST